MKSYIKKWLAIMWEYMQKSFRITFTVCFVSTALYAFQHLGVTTIGLLVWKFLLSLVITTPIIALFSRLIDCLFGIKKNRN